MGYGWVAIVPESDKEIALRVGGAEVIGTVTAEKGVRVTVG